MFGINPEGGFVDANSHLDSRRGHQIYSGFRKLDLLNENSNQVTTDKLLVIKYIYFYLFSHTSQSREYRGD